MSMLYLPIKEFDKENNYNISKMYILKYQLENVQNFLEQIKFLYQDKRISQQSNHYQKDPEIYNILNKIINSECLDLREIDLYCKTKFLGRLINTYTYYERDSHLLNLVNDNSISENIHLANSEQVSNELYLLKLQDMFRNLTINEKNIGKQEFKKIINDFFDLFTFYEKTGKNTRITDFDSGIAYFNAKILKNYPFEKVYKKMC